MRFFRLPLLLSFFMLPCLDLPAQAAAIRSVLVPISLSSTPGANGSRWESEFSFRTSGTEELCLIGDLPLPLCQPVDTTIRFDDFGPELLQFEGALDNTHFSLMVRDASRADQSWGAEIPVVREEEFERDAIALLNVPTDVRYRRNLRLYAFTPEAMRLRVRIWDHRADFLDSSSPPRLLAEESFTLDRENWWISLSDFDARFPALASTDRIRIQIERMSGEGRFWAFVTITNNDTHHVTTVTPQ